MFMTSMTIEQAPNLELAAPAGVDNNTELALQLKKLLNLPKDEHTNNIVVDARLGDPDMESLKSAIAEAQESERSLVVRGSGLTITVVFARKGERTM